MMGALGGAEIRDRHMLSLAEYSTARFDALMHEIEDMAAPLCRVVRERMDKEAADAAIAQVDDAQLASAPAGSNSMMFSQRYRTLEAETTAVNVLSTVACIAVIPLWLIVLAWVDPTLAAATGAAG